MAKRIRTEEQKRQQTIKQLERRRNDPEKYREMGRKSEHRRRLKRYGLTEEQYADLLLKQNNRCAICSTPIAAGRHCHVDHDHSTGKVRGVLCGHCNLMLGHAKDSTDVLLKAVEYLNVK